VQPLTFFDADTPSIELDLVRQADLRAWMDRLNETARAWVGAQDFRALAHTHLAIPAEDGRIARVVVGLGEGAALYSLSDLPLKLPNFSYRLSTALAPELREQLSLGWALGCYQFTRYKAAARAPAKLSIGEDLNRAHIEQLAAAVFLVRDLVNTGAEDMGPADLAEASLSIAHEYGAAFSQVVGDDLLSHGFPAIHAVGRASPRAPRLIELTWGNPEHPKLTIVGKGVCFDTGGLDIKPADGMRNMKKDMGGAAHALALAQLVLSARLPVRLRLLIAAVDNAIAGNAYRPGDVIKTRAGKSVEIGNTDAEGRIVLCDALTYACEDPPALLLDFATLTGAARIALGPDLPALFANQQHLADGLLEAGRATADPLWQLPLWKPYAQYLKSTVADLNNDGGRMAGAITAALYLDEFVAAEVPWAHIDTYAWADRDRPGRPAGGEALSLRAAMAYLGTRFPLQHST